MSTEAGSVASESCTLRKAVPVIEEAMNIILKDISEELPDLSFQFTGESLIVTSSLLDSGFLSDITLLVGGLNPEPFKTHKLVLALNSNVFHAMFFGALPETGTHVEIKDIEPDAFKICLTFIYSGIFPTNMPLELAISVLQCARKYDLQVLETLVASHFVTITSSEIVIRILEVALFLDLKDLESRCWEFIENYTDAVVKHNNFLKMECKTLEQFLKRETLSISEAVLFDGVLRWAKSECYELGSEQHSENWRKVLGPCLPLLRLASMTASEFADGPGKSGLLSPAEIGNVLMYICGNSTTSRGEVLFSPMKRRRPRNIVSPCNCSVAQYRCFYCFKDGIPPSPSENKGIWTGARIITAISTTQIPPFYCSCRIRGHCPAGGNGRGNRFGDRRRRPFSNRTLGLE